MKTMGFIPESAQDRADAAEFVFGRLCACPNSYQNINQRGCRLGAPSRAPSRTRSSRAEWMKLYGLILSSVVSSASFALSAALLRCPSSAVLFVNGNNNNTKRSSMKAGRDGDCNNNKGGKARAEIRKRLFRFLLSARGLC